jgi:nuclear-control-of-ATPase protein 2
MQARGMLYEIVEESLKTSIQPTMQAQLELKKLGSAWCFKEYANPNDIPQCWTQLYEHIRDLHQLRRVGEGKSVKWKDANFVHWFRQYDLLGIPSAWLKVYLASLLHYKILPHWPKIQNFILGSWEIVYEIVTRRFWTPVKDLLTELMYRPNTQLLTGIALTDEETSLDFMLRDLGFGDGKPENRHEAINKATRQYESDMNTGLLRHAMGGRLIRLILIQVQQLKVGMLHAADTVDVLLQANRFNFQLLAIIPAIVIVTVGTKVFFRFLFTLRVKDLRPMSSVHAEMTEYLNGLESVLLLADKNSGNKDDAANQVLTHREMGEFVLTLYDYLVLLDYSSPQPFPSWQSDRIHQSIVEFLGPRGSLTRLGLDDHLQLIDQVKRKHQELAKNL